MFVGHFGIGLAAKRVAPRTSLGWLIAAPLLLSGVAIGLIISVFQSVTSIQDQTLTFVPKIFGMIGVAIILISWIVARLAEFTTEMFTFSPALL